MRNLWLLFTLGGALLLAGCGAKTVRFNAAPELPAAGGWVKVEEDRNHNTELEVHVRHLADPAKLSPPKSLYMVWIQPEGRPVEVLGRLQVDDRLRGKYAGTTPHENFQIFITAEDGPTVAAPSGPVVMRATVDR